MLSYFIRIATLLSQALNTIFLLGMPDMTVSARCYINRYKPYWGVAYKVINKSFLGDVKNAEEVQKWKNNQSF